MGCYMSPEYKITKIDFRLLGSILQECGGLFTVTSGCVFAIVFYFIYKEWFNSALKSVKKYQTHDENTSEQNHENKLLLDLKYRLSFSGLFILYDKVKGFEEQNQQMHLVNQELIEHHDKLSRTRQNQETMAMQEMSAKLKELNM